METTYETYARVLCNNCKNRKICKEELRKRLDNTIKCYSYLKDKDLAGYKEPLVRLANQEKPLMKLNI